MNKIECKVWAYRFSAALIRSTEVGEQSEISEEDQAKLKVEMYKLSRALELVADNVGRKKAKRRKQAGGKSPLHPQNVELL